MSLLVATESRCLRLSRAPSSSSASSSNERFGRAEAGRSKAGGFAAPFTAVSSSFLGCLSLVEHLSSVVLLLGRVWDGE